MKVFLWGGGVYSLELFWNFVKFESEIFFIKFFNFNTRYINYTYSEDLITMNDKERNYYAISKLGPFLNINYMFDGSPLAFNSE